MCPPLLLSCEQVKNAIVTVDANPFKQWYATHYGIDLSKGADQKPIEAKARNPGVPASPAAGVAGSLLCSCPIARPPCCTCHLHLNTQRPSGPRAASAWA